MSEKKEVNDMLCYRNKSEPLMNEKKQKLPVNAMLSYLLIAVALTTGVSFSQYTTSSEGSDSARVAAFVFEVNDQNSSTIQSLEDIKKPKDSQTYTFEVTNSKPGRTSEVTEDYTMAFSALGSLPLEYTLTDVTDSSKPKTITLSKDSSDKSISGTETGSFTAAVSTQKKYELKVKWPEAATDPKYASGSGIASLLITIQAEQVN